MNILIWVLQILLAVHTAIGAVWKFSNSEQTVASLKAIPHGAWLAIAVLEMFCSLGLILPFIKRLSISAPIAAVIIAVEMLLYCGLSVFSGSPEYSHIIYWLVVAAVSGFIAYGRGVLKPQV
jgi:hypothetical protein